MSLVFNMVGGAGGAGLKDTDAVLIVTVPTGSTVTATKGGVTLTPTMWVTAVDPTLDCAIFVIKASLFDSQNAWSVTASLSGITASDTVTIDSNKEYELRIKYPVYLYRDGTEYVTFGTSGYSYESLTLIAFEKQATALYCAGASGDGKLRLIGTTATVNCGGYSKLSVDVDISAAALTGMWLSVTANKTLSNSMSYVSANTTGQYTIDYDISNMNGNYYIALTSGNARNATGYVKAIYLTE